MSTDQLREFVTEQKIIYDLSMMSIKSLNERQKFMSRVVDFMRDADQISEKCDSEVLKLRRDGQRFLIDVEMFD